MVSTFAFIVQWTAWIIGNGIPVRIGIDPWIGVGEKYKLSSCLISLLSENQVFSIVDAAVAVPQAWGLSGWKSALSLGLPPPLANEWSSFTSLLVSKFIHLIQDIKDTLVWSKNTSNGIYTAKLGYKAIMAKSFTADAMF